MLNFLLHVMESVIGLTMAILLFKIKFKKNGPRGNSSIPREPTCSQQSGGSSLPARGSYGSSWPLFLTIRLRIAGFGFQASRRNLGLEGAASKPRFRSLGPEA